jgi:hypothetical protein
MTGNCIWDCGTPHECVGTEGDFDRKMKDIHNVFVNNAGNI